MVLFSLNTTISATVEGGSTLHYIGIRRSYKSGSFFQDIPKTETHNRNNREQFELERDQ